MDMAGRGEERRGEGRGDVTRGQRVRGEGLTRPKPPRLQLNFSSPKTERVQADQGREERTRRTGRQEEQRLLCCESEFVMQMRDCDCGEGDSNIDVVLFFLLCRHPGGSAQQQRFSARDRKQNNTENNEGETGRRRRQKKLKCGGKTTGKVALK